MIAPVDMPLSSSFFLSSPVLAASLLLASEADAEAVRVLMTTTAEPSALVEMLVILRDAVRTFA